MKNNFWITKGLFPNGSWFVFRETPNGILEIKVTVADGEIGVTKWRLTDKELKTLQKEIPLWDSLKEPKKRYYEHYTKPQKKKSRSNRKSHKAEK